MKRVLSVARVLWANRKAELVAAGLLVDVAQQIVRALAH